MAVRYGSVAEYAEALPEDVRPVLDKILATAHRAAPGSGEKISYQIPTITLDDRPLVYVAAWKKHIGVYPVPAVDPDLERELTPYRATKDTLHFPYREPIPHDLITRIVELLVAQRS